VSLEVGEVVASVFFTLKKVFGPLDPAENSRE